MSTTPELAAELAEIQHVLGGRRGTIRLPYVFGHGLCVQVYDGPRKVGPVIIPKDDQTLAEVLAMIGDLVQPDSLNERKAAQS